MVGLDDACLPKKPRHLIRNYPIASRSRMCLKPAVIIKKLGRLYGGKPKSGSQISKGNIRLGCYIAEDINDIRKLAPDLVSLWRV